MLQQQCKYKYCVYTVPYVIVKYNWLIVALGIYIHFILFLPFWGTDETLFIKNRYGGVNNIKYGVNKNKLYCIHYTYSVLICCNVSIQYVISALKYYPLLVLMAKKKNNDYSSNNNSSFVILEP